MNLSSTKEIKITTGFVKLHKNDIVSVSNFSKNTVINYKHMLEIHEARKNLGSPNTDQLLIVDLRLNPKTSKEAMSFGKSEEAKMLNKAVAFIVGSAFSKVLGNLLCEFGGFPYSSKMFTSEEKAVSWLLKQ